MVCVAASFSVVEAVTGVILDVSSSSSSWMDCSVCIVWSSSSSAVASSAAASCSCFNSAARNLFKMKKPLNLDGAYPLKAETIVKLKLLPSVMAGKK